MWFDITAYVVFAMLVIAVLPVTKIRSAAVALLHRGTELAVLALLLAATVFFNSPHRAPAPLTERLQPTADWLDAGIGVEQSGLVWLFVAAGLVAVSLPALVLFDFSRRVASLNATARDPQRDSRKASSGLVRPSAAGGGKVAAAGEHEADNKPTPHRNVAQHSGKKKRGRTVLECLR